MNNVFGLASRRSASHLVLLPRLGAPIPIEQLAPLFVGELLSGSFDRERSRRVGGCLLRTER